MKKLLGLLTHPLLLALIGLGAAAATIWHFGPLLAFAEVRPLETERARWICIGVLVALWLLRQLWKVFKAGRLNARLVDGLLAARPATPAAAPAPSASEQEVAALDRRFEEAIGILRGVRLSAAGRRPGLRDLLALSGRQYLYQLPWYVFIGAPGSGKTTALIHSGLQFPLAEKFGTASLKGVGGTRNCDWWFTDEAVLLDTAGRYTTQESDREVDSAAWQGFLRLLAQARPRRPINGVLLTLSVADLLQQDEGAREAHAAAIRARLQELHDSFQIRLPIYVLVTKADLLAGFNEFFDDLGKDERTQVWGVSLPLADDPKIGTLDGLGSELDLLEERLLARVPERMHAAGDPARAARVFAFPQQFAVLRAPLVDLLERVFKSSRYDEAPLVRGVYFTSGTQEGSPIDRVLGTLARAIGLERKLLPPQAASGRSYFINRLLREVVFPEQGLAGRNQRLERRLNLLRWSAQGAAVLLLIVAGVAWIGSYQRNDAYLGEVAARIPEVRERLAALPPPGSTTDLLDLLPVLDAVRGISDGAQAGAPTAGGYGMQQDGKLGAAADQAYRKLLEDALLPRLGLRVEQQLRGAGANNLEFAYEALKAYLMLNDASHFDADALKSWIRFDWERSLPRAATQEQRAELAAHLDRLFERGRVLNPLPHDENLVASVRNLLARYPLANRVYSRLRREGVGEDFPEFTVLRAAGPSAALVFTRVSGQPLTAGVPGLFSHAGYHQAFKRESERVANQLADEEVWVLGHRDEGAIARLRDTGERSRLIEDVRRLYLNDYARSWEEFLADVKLVRPGNLSQTVDIARLLSAVDSPLPPFLRAAARETTLVPGEADKSIADRAADRLAQETRRLSNLLGGEPSGRPAQPAGDAIENLVDRRFESLRRFVTPPAPGQPAPIDGTLALLGELHVLLTATDTALRAKTALPPSDVPLRVKAQSPGMPEPLRSIVQNLAELSAQLAGGAIVANLEEAIEAEIGAFCRRAIAGRYPFVRSSARDVTQDDFATLFAPGGKMDQFFQTHLASLVDTSTNPWSFRRLSDVNVGGPGSLVQFQRAQRIREVFFAAGGRTPGLKLEFKPLEMDASITQFILDVDGQLVRYGHGPQVPQPVIWPGPRGSTQVRVQVQPPGPTGLSGITTEGPWALFRLFDRVRMAPTQQAERFLVDFVIDDRRAQFEVTASSVQNPFRLREIEQFQCP